jgi:hypothetical protein
MDRSTRHKDGGAGFRGNGLEHSFHPVLFNGPQKIGSFDARTKTDEDLRARNGIEHVPAFGLGLAAVQSGRLLVGVNLDAQPFARIDQLDEKRKRLRMRGGGSNQIGTVFGCQAGKSQPSGRALGHDAHAFGASRYFP